MTRRRPPTLAPAFCSRTALAAEQRRIDGVRSAPPRVFKNDDGPRVWGVRGFTDAPHRQWSELGWQDANGVQRSNSAFVNGEHAGSNWLRDREGKPGDW